MAVRNTHGNNSSTAGESRRGMVLPFQPLSLVFDHMNYYVDMPAVSLIKILLNCIFIALNKNP